LTLLVSGDAAYNFSEALKDKKFENHMLFHWYFVNDCQVILIFACGDIVTNEKMMSVLIMAILYVET